MDIINDPQRQKKKSPIPEEIKQSEEKSIPLVDKVVPVYANIVRIEHNQEEFHLYFIAHAGEMANTVAKVIVTPGHLKRFLDALNENLAIYDEKFGDSKLDTLTDSIKPQEKHIVDGAEE